MRGTAVHDYAARMIAGESVDVPDEYIGHVDACLDFLSDWQISELAVEAVVVNRGNDAGVGRYMGCLDLLAYPSSPSRDGDLWLFDWKTGASGIWPEAALQLAAYAHAQTMLAPDGEEITFPHVEAAAAVWLKADGYEVRPVDIGDDTFRDFLYVQQVARFAKADRGTYVRDAITPPERAAS